MPRKRPIPKPVAIVALTLLLAGLLGGVGYVLWDNFNQERHAATSPSMTTRERSDAPAPVKSDDNLKQYTNETYTFSYLAEGWVLEEGDESTGYHPSLETENLTTEPFVIKTGAGIYIRTFPASEGKKYDELIQNPDSLPEDIYTDIKKTTVAGQEAHSYTLNYEGTRYITEFYRGDTSYQIIFQVAEDQRSQYEPAYQRVVTSFQFK